MTPEARLQAAIDILDTWRTGGQSVDRVLTAWGRRNRYAGSGDRRAISDLVHDGLRRMRSAAWRGGGDAESTGRQIMIGLALLSDQDPQHLFSGARHAPAPLTDEERGALRDLTAAPPGVRFDYPDWLAPDFEHYDQDVLTLLRSRAPLDLRVNTLRADPARATAALAADGVTTAPIDGHPLALRVLDGQRKVQQTEAFQDGLVEVQDAASQAIATIAAPQPGETVLDLCAGAGGKTLAMAAAMQNRGRLIAYDIAPARIAPLVERANRAKAKVEVIGQQDLPTLHNTCDLVLIDAPCSGSGTWRRNPDAKWRLTPARLEDLLEAQATLLRDAIRYLKPNGRLAYATCSMLSAENEDQVQTFLDRSPGWRLQQAQRFDPGAPGDAMYAAILTRV